ncbi:Uncharacterized protein SCF082_LOCUS15424 [Durusdinium trenchii]|uniref:Uncharacterized protein n=1 Tax=Durusdinium trenchii TaxID=1381693 RepID=A0ABP0K4C4_9DINO
MDVDEDFKSATDLARAWEGIPHLRRRGSQLRVVLVHFDKKINRDTVVENEQLINMTMRHLGTRVTISNLELHLRSFYDLMSVNIPCHIIGQQAWALRRMISTYNAVVRRPHIPRQRGLRRLMINQGLDVPLDLPSSSASLGGHPDPETSSSSSSDEPSGSSDGEEEEEGTSEDELVGHYSCYMYIFGPSFSICMRVLQSKQLICQPFTVSRSGDGGNDTPQVAVTHSPEEACCSVKCILNCEDTTF